MAGARQTNNTAGTQHHFTRAEIFLTRSAQFREKKGEKMGWM